MRNQRDGGEWLNEVINENKKIYLGEANKKIAESLGIESAKIVARGSAIAHILKRHGIDSINAKNGQPPVTLQDIQTHGEIVNNADMQKIALNKDNQKVLISGKQINGYYVVVETISEKKGELSLKTMYKENGKLDSDIFKDKALPSDTAAHSLVANSTSANLDGFQALSKPDSTTLPKEWNNLNAKEKIEFLKERQIEKSRQEVRGKDIQVLRAELQDILKSKIGKEIVNKSTGIKASISNKGIKKMLSDKAVQKSINNGFSKEEHFRAVSNIEELFIKSKFLHTREDIKHSQNSIKIHEFLADNGNSVARILLKESIDKDLKKIYTLELQNLDIAKYKPLESYKDLATNLSISKDKSDSTLAPMDNPNSTTFPITFIDNKGKERILSKEVAQEWLDTFNLKSLDESYIPNHSEKIKEALGGKELKLTKGSLLKLATKDRTQYIPYIKETLNNPDFILRDVDNMLIFAKKINDRTHFTSINLEKNDYFISVSNAPKKENILKIS